MEPVSGDHPRRQQTARGLGSRAQAQAQHLQETVPRALGLSVLGRGLWVPQQPSGQGRALSTLISPHKPIPLVRTTSLLPLGHRTQPAGRASPSVSGGGNELSAQHEG